MGATPRDEWIDWLRGLAAAAVCIFHFNEVRPETGWYGDLASYGHLGVAVFFVLSGYCIRAAANRATSSLGFVIARVLRIYPPYLLSLVIVAGVVAWRVVTFGSNDVTVVPKTLGAVAATLTLTTSPVTDVPTVNWVYWTLSFELAFYAVLALALLLRSLSATLLIVCTAASCIPDLAGIPGLFFLKHWGLFALGIALKDALDRRPVGLPLGILAVISIGLNELPPSQATAAIVAAAAALAALFAPRLKRIHIPPLSFMGDVSYSVYLLHVPIGVYVLGRFLDLGAEVPIRTALAQDAAMFAIVLAMSAVTYRFVEQPSIALGRRLSKRNSLGHKAPFLREPVA